MTGRAAIGKTIYDDAVSNGTVEHVLGNEARHALWLDRDKVDVDALAKDLGEFGR